MYKKVTTYIFATVFVVLAGAFSITEAQATQRSVYGVPCTVEFRPSANGTAYGSEGHFSIYIRTGGSCTSGSYVRVHFLSVGANGSLSYDSAQMYTGEELRHMMAQMLEAGRTGKYVRVYYDDMITTMSSSVYQARWAVF